MPEFLDLLPPIDALDLLLTGLSGPLAEERVETAAAWGRVTAGEVPASHDLPAFARSTVDGYAARAADTFGAGDSLPAYLRLAGEIAMGQTPSFALKPGECGLIHTGGMLPAGADAVVMIEHTQIARPDEIEILRAVAPGHNVIQVGEDIRAGAVVLPAGVRLRPAEIGALMALGLTTVTVARRPRVTIISSGDEVVPPHQAPGPGQVRDVNSYTLAALVEEAGGQPIVAGLMPDRPDAFLAAGRRALAEGDVVVFTAGSSVSSRDLTAQTIAALGEPGVLVHGVNVRPGKPTILARCRGKAVLGLPGNPVSALLIASLFLTPVIETLLGLRRDRPRASVPARLALNLSSAAGREDWVPVALSRADDGFLAEPVFGKSNLIFTLVRADGLVRIPPAANGLPAGATVSVTLL